MQQSRQHRAVGVEREWSEASIREKYEPQVKRLSKKRLMALSRGDHREAFALNVGPIVENIANEELERRGVVLPTLASLMEPLTG